MFSEHKISANTYAIAYQGFKNDFSYDIDNY